MEFNETRPHYCPSLGGGDILENRYRILRPIPNQSVVGGIRMDALDLETGEKVVTSIPLRKTPYDLPLPEEFHYYRITEINEDENTGKTSLTLIEVRENKEPNFRTFHVPRQDQDQDDIESIREGLQKNQDYEVFCTIVKIMGKEVLGNIKVLPIDPAIFKLPVEILEMIWNKLDYSDLYSLRLASPIFAFDYLPIQNLWTISDLLIGYWEDQIRIRQINKEGGECQRSYCHQRQNEHRTLLPQPPLPQPFSQANPEWLRTTKILKVNLYWPNRCPEEDWEALAKNCTQLETLEVWGRDEGDQTLNISQITSAMILGNQDTLKKLKIKTTLPYTLDLADLVPCKNIEEIKLCGKRGTNEIQNFETLVTLKDKLRILHLEGFATPFTKERVLWITENFKNLEKLTLPMVHSCDLADTKDQEVDEHFLRSIMRETRLPKLEKLRIQLISCQGYRWCTKADRIARGAILHVGVLATPTWGYKVGGYQLRFDSNVLSFRNLCTVRT